MQHFTEHSLFICCALALREQLLHIPSDFTSASWKNLLYRAALSTSELAPGAVLHTPRTLLSSSTAFMGNVVYSVCAHFFAKLLRVFETKAAECRVWEVMSLPMAGVLELGNSLISTWISLVGWMLQWDWESTEKTMKSSSNRSQYAENPFSTVIVRAGIT